MISIIANAPDFCYDLVVCRRKMGKKIALILLVLNVIIAAAVLGQSAQETAINNNILKVTKEINRLQKEIKKAKTAAKKNQLNNLLQAQRQTLIGLNEQLSRAVANSSSSTENGQAEIAKVKAEINRLTLAIQKARVSAKKNQLRKLRQAQYDRLRELTAAAEPTGKTIGEELVTPEAYNVTPEALAEKRFRFDLGGTVGVFCGAVGINGEVRFPLRFVVGPARASLRFSTGFEQSKDSSRRYVPVCFDGILNFPPGWFTGVENYLGAGLNYVALTSGRVSGTVGGQIFYGVESDGFGGRVFGEIGYGYLRTGFDPSHKGLTVMAGFRQPLGF
jgi:hypothetical protein